MEIGNTPLYRGAMEDLSALPPLEFSQRINELLAQACPDQHSEPFFNQQLVVAGLVGLSYDQALQFVVHQRAKLK